MLLGNGRRALGILLAVASSGCGGSETPTPTTPPGNLGTVIAQVPNEGWTHVPEGSPIAYRHNPPASGPHYPVWLRYEAYTIPMARGYWVHNLEHGGIVFLHRRDAPASVVTDLTNAYRSLPADPKCGDARALLTPDADMPRPVAVVAANWALEADGVDADAIRAFALAHRDQAPESICGGGTRP